MKAKYANISEAEPGDFIVNFHTLIHIKSMRHCYMDTWEITGRQLNNDNSTEPVKEFTIYSDALIIRASDHVSLGDLD
jgi:hypothetical protein